MTNSKEVKIHFIKGNHLGQCYKTYCGRYADFSDKNLTLNHNEITCNTCKKLFDKRINKLLKLKHLKLPWYKKLFRSLIGL